MLTHELGLDTVVAIGTKAQAIRDANPDALWFPTVQEALPAIREAFIPGTAILVKASHAMHFTDIVADLETSTK